MFILAGFRTPDAHCVPEILYIGDDGEQLEAIAAKALLPRLAKLCNPPWQAIRHWNDEDAEKYEALLKSETAGMPPGTFPVELQSLNREELIGLIVEITEEARPAFEKAQARIKELEAKLAGESDTILEALSQNELLQKANDSLSEKLGTAQGEIDRLKTLTGTKPAVEAATPDTTHVASAAALPAAGADGVGTAAPSPEPTVTKAEVEDLLGKVGGNDPDPKSTKPSKSNR